MKPVKQYKLSKKLKMPIFEKCQTSKFALREQRNTKFKSFRRPMSRFGQQLIEKQKLRFSYGINEKNLKNYVSISLKNKTKSREDSLLELLESRLDSVVYNSGFIPTRRMARQMISHGHFLVNGKKTKVSSRQIKTTDQISIREGSKKTTLFGQLTGSKPIRKSSNSVKFDDKKFTISMEEVPKYLDSSIYDFATIFEFYLR